MSLADRPFRRRRGRWIRSWRFRIGGVGIRGIPILGFGWHFRARPARGKCWWEWWKNSRTSCLEISLLIAEDQGIVRGENESSVYHWARRDGQIASLLPVHRFHAERAAAGGGDSVFAAAAGDV